MDGTHGQHQGAPGVTKLSFINHTEMWPLAISCTTFLYLKVLKLLEGCRLQGERTLAVNGNISG